MTYVMRVLLYTFCLFLVMIVYTGQRHATAEATLRAAAQMTARVLGWSIVGVLVMLGLQLALVD